MSGELVTSIANRASLSSRRRGTVKRRTQRSRHSDASESFYGIDLTQTLLEETPWSNVSNANGSPDGSEANVELLALASAEFLIETAALPFVVPLSAVLTGFTARVIARRGAANITLRAQMFTGSNVPVGSEKSVTISTSAKEIVFGSRTDLWGTGWTASDMRSNGVKLGIRAVSGPIASEAFIDSMRLTAHYG